MKQYLMLASLLVGVLQAAGDLIKSFEVAGFGQEKKALILSLLEGVFNVLKSQMSSITMTFKDVESIVSGAIDAIVNFLNVAKIFKK